MSEHHDFFALDSEVGPARLLEPKQSAQLISNVLDQWTAEVPMANSNRQWPKAAVYALAMLIGTSSASVAAWVYFSPPETTEVTSAPAPIKEIAPVLIEAPAPQQEEVEPPTEIETPASETAIKRRRVYKSKKSRAADLLKQANALRGGQDWQRAARAYALVAQKFKGSDSEYVALVSEAEIQFEQLENFERAKFCYRRALVLRANGVLEAEILFGLSRVHQTEGELEKEKQVLETIMSKHAHSPFASPAKMRLDKLQ